MAFPIARACRMAPEFTAHKRDHAAIEPVELTQLASVDSVQSHQR